MPPARLEAMFGAAIPFLRHDPRSDAELLARFLDFRDEIAFEALLVRHTPAVRAACRGWLRSAADIDDAAQATFLVLVQRAGTIRNRAALGCWLYRVAANVARRLRRQRPASCPVPDDVPGRAPTGDDDLRDLLAEEIARLPEKYRLPVQLCYGAGLTTAEAARRLGWPKGTVLTRLARARERLQKALARRGVAPAALPGLAATAEPALGARWVHQTAGAAKDILAGVSPAGTGVSGRTVSLTEGVVRAMMFDRLKFVVLATLVAVGLAGFGVRYWASAPDGPGSHGGKSPPADVDPRAAFQLPPAAAREKELGNPPAAPGKDAAKADDAKPGTPGRRHEVVIQLPSGTFVKEVEAAPYGSGRLTWTYEEDRVLGLIEASVMGVEVELATEAEYSLSSNGTIYGLLTSVRLNHVRLPDGEPFAQIKPFIGLWPAVEPIVSEVLTDLPFSYRFRVQGDRLIISNFRILLAGPNPLGKLGGMAAAGGGSGNEAFAALAAFQALGTALEGTYTSPDSKEKPAPGKRPLFMKPRSPGDAKAVK
jgi:RNA polymerase sigma factor (sigma-70 family)